MDITYTVHRASTHPVEVDVDYGGEHARAMLPELEVELFHGGQKHGSLTLRFRTQAEIAAARECFEAGERVTLSFAKVHGSGATKEPPSDPSKDHPPA